MNSVNKDPSSIIYNKYEKYELSLYLRNQTTNQLNL